MKLNGINRIKIMIILEKKLKKEICQKIFVGKKKKNFETNMDSLEPVLRIKNH